MEIPNGAIIVIDTNVLLENITDVQKWVGINVKHKNVHKKHKSEFVCH